LLLSKHLLSPTYTAALVYIFNDYWVRSWGDNWRTLGTYCTQATPLYRHKFLLLLLLLLKKAAKS
jgi:hypothetical protein